MCVIVTSDCIVHMYSTCTCTRVCCMNFVDKEWLFIISTCRFDFQRLHVGRFDPVQSYMHAHTEYMYIVYNCMNYQGCIWGGGGAFAPPIFQRYMYIYIYIRPDTDILYM